MQNHKCVPCPPGTTNSFRDAAMANPNLRYSATGPDTNCTILDGCRIVRVEMIVYSGPRVGWSLPLAGARVEPHTYTSGSWFGKDVCLQTGRHQLRYWSARPMQHGVTSTDPGGIRVAFPGNYLPLWRCWSFPRCHTLNGTHVARWYTTHSDNPHRSYADIEFLVPRVPSYIKTPDAAIMGYNQEQVIGTVWDCVAACEARTWCKSFDYYKSLSKCDLSTVAAAEVDGLKTDYPGNPYDHYEKPGWYEVADGHCRSGYLSTPSHHGVLTLQACKISCMAQETCRYVSYSERDNSCALYTGSCDSRVAIPGFRTWARASPGIPLCGIEQGYDQSSGFTQIGYHTGSMTDVDCQGKCSRDWGCTAWVRRSSTGECWTASGDNIRFAATQDRNAGRPCHVCTLPVGTLSDGANCDDGESGCNLAVLTASTLSCASGYGGTPATSGAACSSNKGKFAGAMFCTENVCTLPVGTLSDGANCDDGESGCNLAVLTASTLSCASGYGGTPATSGAACSSNKGKFAGATFCTGITTVVDLPSCGIEQGYDQSSGFTQIGYHTGSMTDVDCQGKCSTDWGCTAWVRRPSTGECWTGSGDNIRFAATQDRNAGRPCDTDCVMNLWTLWGSCSFTVGGQSQFRYRSIRTPLFKGGAACTSTQESRSCDTQNADYERIHTAADCCRSNGAGVGSVSTGQAPSPAACEVSCNTNPNCRYFSHSNESKNCDLCSECDFMTTGSGANYTSWKRSKTPTCTDGSQNGDELEIDCGGSCPFACACNETLSGNGADYRGCQTRTRSGKFCQRWYEQHLHAPSDVASAGLVSNYCRNPDGKSYIWCYTTDPTTPWEYCNSLQTASTCRDGSKNGDETGVDCGGSCSACDAVHTCDFSSGAFSFCDGLWTTSGGQFTWKRNSGSTPSSSTGPLVGPHGYLCLYIYLEAGSPYSPSKTAYPTSKPGLYSAMNFKYYMYASIGSVAVEVLSAKSLAWTQVWLAAAHGWSTAQVLFNGTVDQVRFVGVTGSGFRSDAAVAAVQLVVAADTTAPVFSACPAVVKSEAISLHGSVVHYTGLNATDDVGATVSCSPSSGSIFAIGSTSVTCTASDPSGNTATCSFNVTVAGSSCAAGWHAVNNSCVPCPPGFTTAAGDQPRGPDTICEVWQCQDNEHVQSNTCMPCPPGHMSSIPGSNATGPDTACTAIPCGVNQSVQNHSSAACPGNATCAAAANVTGNHSQCKGSGAAFVGFTPWDQDRQPHAVQDDLMDKACAATYGPSARAASWDELFCHSIRSVLPKSSAGNLLVLKGVNCGGCQSAHQQNARDCHDAALALPAACSQISRPLSCWSSTRQTMCVKPAPGVQPSSGCDFAVAQSGTGWTTFCGGVWTTPASGGGADVAWVQHMGPAPDPRNGWHRLPRGPSAGPSGRAHETHLFAYQSPKQTSDLISAAGADNGVSFEYHMYGSWTDTLSVEVQGSNGEVWRMWQKCGKWQFSKSEAWLEAHIVFPATAVKVRLVSITGEEGEAAAAAIADVQLHPSPTPYANPYIPFSIPQACDFGVLDVGSNPASFCNGLWSSPANVLGQGHESSVPPFRMGPYAGPRWQIYLIGTESS